MYSDVSCFGLKIFKPVLFYFPLFQIVVMNHSHKKMKIKLVWFENFLTKKELTAT